ncbi:hypothetical protein [Streptosporangium sp. NPDC002524]|uniref:hypothetical protein n=1 Tax=Streptosporangium sp. NPDC002524 TaxID=3154537 RepID=UPI00331DF773
MALRFIGIDPNTGGNNCPSVWIDNSDGSIVIQGWEVTDPAELAEVSARSPILAHEKIVRLPRRMVPFLLEACGDELTDDIR